MYANIVHAQFKPQFKPHYTIQVSYLLYGFRTLRSLEI